MTKRFSWCRQEIIFKCTDWISEAHAHICIRSLTAEIRHPRCDGPVVHLAFHDLDPEQIKRTNAFANDPDKGREIMKGCMNEAQALQIVKFVESIPDDKLIVVNCEAGVSRSPAVVLAMRKKYGGDMEECYRKAYPNIHVASMVSKALGGDVFPPHKPVLEDQNPNLFL